MKGTAKAGVRASTKRAKVKPPQKVEVVSKPRDPGRFVSQVRLSEVLGRNRTTIREWDAAGMPAQQRGDRAAGRDWIYDIAEVLTWRERVVAEKVRADMGGGEEGDGDPSNPLGGLKGLDLIKAQDALVKLAIKQRYAVNPEAVAAIWTRAFRDIGNALMALPDLYARDLGGYPEDMVRDWGRTTKLKIDSILKSASNYQADAVRKLAAEPDEDAEDRDSFDEIED